MKMVFCRQCGLLLPPGHTACPRCGTPAPAPAASRSQAAPHSAAPPPPRYAAQPQEPGGLSTAGYFAVLCLFFVPVAGLIAMLVWSCSAKNPARRRLARAYLLRQVILSALLLVLALGLTVLPFWQLTGILPLLSGRWGGFL